MKNKGWLKLVVFGGVGATLGFAYYYFIGCYNGTCPITGNPFISSGYGALMGIVLGWGRGSKKKSSKK